MLAAMTGKVEVIRILLQAGADVNITRPASSDLDEEEGDTESALTVSLALGQPESAQVLLDHGADKKTFQWMTPSQSVRNLRDHRVLRMFYIAGVDISARNVEFLGTGTFEEVARRRLARHIDAGRQPLLVRRYAQIVEVLDGVRLAGSYKQYILQDYKQLLRMRSLLARSRATLAPETPEVIRRLFGGTTAVPTRRSRPPPKRSAGVPDPIFWKVLEYWRLGDWRRPCTLPLD